MKELCKICQQIHELKDKHTKEDRENIQEIVFGNLLMFEDYNNGVSEYTASYYCSACHSFYEYGHNIGMEQWDFWFKPIKEVSDALLTLLAGYLQAEVVANRLEKSVEGKEMVTVFEKTDTYIPHSFYSEDEPYDHEKAEKFTDFQLNKLYGINNENGRTNSYFVHLSLDELLGSYGSNDAYTKKSYVMKYEIPVSELHFGVSHASAYADVETQIRHNVHILPENITIFDPTTGIEKLITETSEEELSLRDDEAYLSLAHKMMEKKRESAESTKVEVQAILSELKEKMAI